MSTERFGIDGIVARGHLRGQATDINRKAGQEMSGRPRFRLAAVLNRAILRLDAA